MLTKLVVIRVIIKFGLFTVNVVFHNWDTWQEEMGMMTVINEDNSQGPSSDISESEKFLKLLIKHGLKLVVFLR